MTAVYSVNLYRVVLIPSFDSSLFINHWLKGCRLSDWKSAYCALLVLVVKAQVPSSSEMPGCPGFLWFPKGAQPVETLNLV